MENKLTLSKSLETGFIDQLIHSQKRYRPELLTNNKAKEKKVLTHLIRELELCDEFWFTVAFVTTGGVATLMNTLIELERKQIKGKVLVSQYLNFTQPEALKRIKKFTNIDLRIATASKGDFHSKAYLFKRDDLFNLIIGSSNLTQTALCTNKEWNLKVSATGDSELINLVQKEFLHDFEQGEKVTEQFIFEYNKIYQTQNEWNRKTTNNAQKIQKSLVTPNNMQKEALLSIEQLRAQGKSRALLISATGTGKTYLSAFDVQNFKPKKFLYIVHRRTIALEAKKTFESLLGGKIEFGVFSGSQQDLNADYIFSTIQTISKQEHLDKFNPEEFDYIVIDETHRAGADSYKRIMTHFKPKFLLGMTATPERTDVVNVFELFDYNIAYEIRLHQALFENMLSPFHYYGITDLTIDNQQVDDKTDFNLLTSDERIDRIIEKSEMYGTDTGDVNCLVFCSRKDECNQLSNGFNQRGYRSIALTGDSLEEERAHSIQRLESHSNSEKLDYIFTVDIFNEGVDIPSVNQIIMLRPTQSAIIFVQQLGRGLRKVDSKEYLTVIDFIGNYSNNYLVPIALYGDTSYNKDTLRKLIASGSRVIPGSSTINFDQISKEKIFEAIDSANMQMKKDLVKDYQLLKFEFGRIPMMMDFVAHGARNPKLYVNYSKSYFNFVAEQEAELRKTINSHQKKLLEVFSSDINNGQRVEESLILKGIIEKGEVNINSFKEMIDFKYGYIVSDDTLQSCFNNLNLEFITENKNNKLKSIREIYELNVIRKENQKLIIEQDFKENLSNDEFRRFLLDNIDYSIATFESSYQKEMFVNGFMMYKKYSRKDTFRILNWEKNPVAQNVGGYIVSKDETNCPIFVNYHKEEDISSTTKYEDVFINQYEFEWMSKSRRTLESPDVKSIRNSKMRLPLFIKRSNDEGKEFYYMGDVLPIDDTFEETKMKDDKGNNISVVKVVFKMNIPVDDEIFEYLTNN